ncbi:TonB-dependent receptor [Emticicia sp. W12TSBA100-4]|uniref:SusC/RagA family TonB-linked outer membrane protein n=1 Tax=Emticicia sp. W12TSBA100-4 TaxID=3160965 RepID=UPI003305F533
MMMRKNLLSLLFAVIIGMQAFAQDKTVSGKVTSADDGTPLPGVSVSVKGTSRGTTTDASGVYKISVSGNATLIFSFIGFTSQQVGVNNRTIIDLQLASDAQELSEAVVVGYGTQSRRTLTGSQASVKGSEIATMPTNSFDKALQGRAAGVQILGANGTPGGAAQVRVRGVGTIKGGTDPLYVVDGVQINSNSGSAAFTSSNPLNYLNPNDIESIEVLKDAASAAIYGAAAANGVVLITTKKGKSGATKVSFDYFTGMVEPTQYLDVLNTQEWIAVRNEALINQSPTTEPGAAMRTTLGAIRLDPALTTDQIAALPTYDWQKESYVSGRTNNYSISLNGGSEKSTFYLSGSYNGTDANVRNVDYKGGNINAKISNKVTSRLTVDNSINLSSFIQRGQFGGPGGGSFLGSPTFSAPLILPHNPFYKDDGTYYGTPADGGIAGILNQNVLMVSDLNKIESRVNQAIASTVLTYKIMKGLSFRPSASIDYRFIKGFNFQDPRTADAFNVRGRIQNQNTENINFILNAVVNYDKQISSVHNISALAGAEYRKDQSENVQQSAEGIPTPQFTVAGAAANPITTFASWSAFKKAGVFGRVSYDYAGKYLLGLTARYDGSSRFGANNLWGFFPGISAGWDLSQEAFLKNNAYVNQLKLRVSYGSLGADQIGNFDSRGLYGGGFNYGGVSGIAPTQLANPNLRWEQNITTNFAIDYGLFNNRVQGSLEYFIRTSKDLILDRPVTWLSGYSTISENVGELQNKGLEFDIKTVNIDKSANNRGFKWTTSFNFTQIDNKVTKLYDTLTTLPGRAVDGWIKIGYPVNSIYTAEYAGVNPATGRAMWYDNNGNIIYRLAGNPDSYSKIIGGQIPKYYGGLTNTFSFKGFDLEVFLNYEFGRTVFNNQSAFMAENGGRLFNTLRSIYENRWTTPGQITTVPRPFNGNAETLGSGITAGSRFYEDASFIRVKTLTFGYNFSRDLLKKVKIDRARLYVQGYNLYTWSKWTGFDSEFINLGSGNNGAIPQPRTITFGLQLGL